MKHIIQHNLRQSSVLFTDKHFETKLLAPSLGIVRKDNIITGYGEICLFSNSDNILRGSKIYSSDIYSPRLDFLVSKIDSQKVKEINKKYDIYMSFQDGAITEYDFENQYKKKLMGKIEGDSEYSDLLKEKIDIETKLMNIGYKSRDYEPIKSHIEDKELIENITNKINSLVEELGKQYNYVHIIQKSLCQEDLDENTTSKLNELVTLKYELFVACNIHKPMLDMKYKKEDLDFNIKGINSSLEDKYLEPFKNNNSNLNEYNNLINRQKEINTKLEPLIIKNMPIFEERCRDIYNEIIKDGFYMFDKLNKNTGSYSLKKMDNEKILKELTSNIVNGENFYGGEFVYFRNAMADQYSLNEYSKFTNRLASNEEESQKSIKTFDTYIENKYKMNSLEFYKKFENGEIDRNDYKELRNEFNKIFQPHYMEAKPLREISYSEFNFAFVPENCDKDVIKILEQNGLDIHYYEENEDLNIKLLNLTIETSNDKKEIEELCEHTNDDISLKAMDRLSTFEHNLKETINEASNYSDSNENESTNTNKNNHKHR